jgi:hypothetical protein
VSGTWSLGSNYADVLCKPLPQGICGSAKLAQFLICANDGGAFSPFRVGAGSARVRPHVARIEGMMGKVVDFLLFVGCAVGAVWFLIHLRHG